MALALVANNTRGTRGGQAPRESVEDRRALYHAKHNAWFFRTREENILKRAGETVLLDHIDQKADELDLDELEYTAVLLGLHHRRTLTNIHRPITAQALNHAYQERLPGWSRFGDERAQHLRTLQLEADIKELLRYSPEYRDSRELDARVDTIYRLIGLILRADELSHAS